MSTQRNRERLTDPVLLGPTDMPVGQIQRLVEYWCQGRVVKISDSFYLVLPRVVLCRRYHVWALDAACAAYNAIVGEKAAWVEVQIQEGVAESYSSRVRRLGLNEVTLGLDDPGWVIKGERQQVAAFLADAYKPVVLF